MLTITIANERIEVDAELLKELSFAIRDRIESRNEVLPRPKLTSAMNAIRVAIDRVREGRTPAGIAAMSAELPPLLIGIYHDGELRGVHEHEDPRASIIKLYNDLLALPGYEMRPLAEHTVLAKGGGS